MFNNRPANQGQEGGPLLENAVFAIVLGHMTVTQNNMVTFLIFTHLMPDSILL